MHFLLARSIYVLFLLATTHAFTPPSRRVLHDRQLVPRDPYSHHGHFKRSLDREEHIRALWRRLEDGMTPGLDKRSVGQTELQTLTLRQEDSRGEGEIRKRDVNGTISYLGTKSGIYILDVPVGTPSTTYPLQLDLASSDLLLISSFCTSSSCPHLSSSLPSYDPAKSTSFSSIKANDTVFNATFADSSGMSGFISTETVWLGSSKNGLQRQVIGVVNQTTVNAGGEGISGIVGFGFPRLSLLARAGLGMDSQSSQSAQSPVSASSTTDEAGPSSSTDSSSSAAAPSSTAVTTYYPPVLEHLFSDPTKLVPYPIFSIALANSSTPYSAATANASLTLGGVREGLVLPSTDANKGSGRTVEDIEWVDVVPFAPAVPKNGTTSTSPAETSTAGGISANTLEEEEYLYWTLPLANVTMNGTSVPIRPTYNSTQTPTSHSIALLDLGTNGIYAPQQDVIALFSMVTDARQVSDGQWAVPCSTRMTMTFAFATGANGAPGRVIELQPSEWMFGKVVGTTMCLAWPVVLPPGADGIDWQLGTPFLRKVYSVFSYGINGVQAPLVGFLPLPSPKEEQGGGSSTTQTATTASEPIFSILPISVSTDASGSVIVPPTVTSSRDPANPTPTSVQGSAEVDSRLTVTIGTTLPNVILPNPSHTTPPYAFETTSIPHLGSVQTIGLANASVWPSIQPVTIVRTEMAAMTRSSASSPGSTGGSQATSAAEAAAGIVAARWMLACVAAAWCLRW